MRVESLEGCTLIAVDILAIFDSGITKLTCGRSQFLVISALFELVIHLLPYLLVQFTVCQFQVIDTLYLQTEFGEVGLIVAIELTKQSLALLQ